MQEVNFKLEMSKEEEKINKICNDGIETVKYNYKDKIVDYFIKYENILDLEMARDRYRKYKYKNKEFYISFVDKINKIMDKSDMSKVEKGKIIEKYSNKMYNEIDICNESAYTIFAKFIKKYRYKHKLY